MHTLKTAAERMDVKESEVLAYVQEGKLEVSDEGLIEDLSLENFIVQRHIDDANAAQVRAWEMRGRETTRVFIRNRAYREALEEIRDQLEARTEELYQKYIIEPESEWAREDAEKAKGAC
jgi:hypothetical protein